MHEYFALVSYRTPTECAVLRAPDSMPSQFKAATGVRLAADYSPLEFTMADEVPGIQVADFIRNSLGFLMVRRKVRNLLAEHATVEIEYLQFKLLDHKGRVADPDCSIVNVIGTVDCVDLARTKGVDKAGRPGQFLEIRELHLLSDKIPPQANIFRIAARPRMIVVRDDLRAEFAAASATGVRFAAMGEPIEL